MTYENYLDFLAQTAVDMFIKGIWNNITGNINSGQNHWICLIQNLFMGYRFSIDLQCNGYMKMGNCFLLPKVPVDFTMQSPGLAGKYVDIWMLWTMG